MEPGRLEPFEQTRLEAQTRRAPHEDGRRQLLVVAHENGRLDAQAQRDQKVGLCALRRLVHDAALEAAHGVLELFASGAVQCAEDDLGLVNERLFQSFLVFLSVFCDFWIILRIFYFWGSK